MKIVKILPYIIIFSLQVYANEHTFTAQTNIAKALNISEEVKWSLNGGIFSDSKDGITIKQTGLYKILLLNTTGKIEILDVNITNGTSEKLKRESSIYIDNKSPALVYSWANIIKQDGVVFTGPNSQLFWESDDPNALFEVYINDKLSDIKNPPLQFNKKISTIKIKTLDVLNNETLTVVAFKQNFSVPNIDWKLAEPSLFENNKWYSKNKSKLILSHRDGLTYELNGKPFDAFDKVVKIDNNSQLSATDSLGNTAIKTISWIVDNDPPSLVFKTLEGEQRNIKKLKVKTNQDIYLSAEDLGAGLLDASFFSAKRKWEPLPKTFVFLSPGSYKISVKSKDKLGNNLKSKIKVRVKKGSQ
jgi:hypothetical protein